MGLRPLIRQLRTASPRAAGLASSLQLASTTCQPWLQATHHPNPTEQRGGFTQLAFTPLLQPCAASAIRHRQQFATERIPVLRRQPLRERGQVVALLRLPPPPAGPP